MVKLNKEFQRALYTLKCNGIELLPHQKEALVWMLRRERVINKDGSKRVGPFGGIIADEMGLGKTLETISIILGNPKHTTLIVVPANLINQWVSEFEKFAPKTKVYINNIPDRIDKDEPIILITSYIKAIRNDCIMSSSWDRIILDEGHYIRNSKGVVHKSIIKIKGAIKWVLSGTPIQNYMSDLISILKFIGFTTIQLEEIEFILSKYILRRTKKGLNFNLPDIDVESVIVEHTSLYEKSFYKRVENNIFKKSSFHWLELLLRLRQASILPQLVYDGYTKKKKLKPIKWKYSNSKLNRIVDTIVKHPEEKPLIFCFFKREIEYLKEKLELNSISFEVICGSVSMDERQRIISSSNSYKVLILQMMAGSTGLNLQMFNSVHFTAPHWNPTHEDQAIARVYRIGQKNNVKVRKYILKNTIEETIVKIQNRKNEMINDMIN